MKISKSFAFGVCLLCHSIWIGQSLCLSGTRVPVCLENIDENETIEKLEYIKSKYEEVDMRIIGTPIGIRGKRITEGDFVEIHIVFQYIDHTVHDIMQTCAFILKTRPGECESISTVCNSFLHTTPRPLLEREELTVCEDENPENDEAVNDDDNANQNEEGAAETRVDRVKTEK